MKLRRAALAALALLTIFLGANLYTATSRFVTAFDTYNRLELRLDRFAFGGPDAPVSIDLTIGNPTRDRFIVRALEVRLDAGARRVGGGDMRREIAFAPGQYETLRVDAAINDRTYVGQLRGQAIDWGVSGRVLVELGHGVEAVWIPFATRYVTEAGT